MKRLTSSLVVCMLMLGTAACTANTETEEPPQTQEMTAEQQAQAVDDMTAPVDSLVRCMLENGMEYDPQDPEFFWTSLAYFAGQYGSEHQLAEVTDDSITLPSKAVQELAIALFADYDDLLELPDSLSGRVTYDESTDAYTFGRGDIGLAETKLTFKGEEDGVVTVQADLVSLMEDQDIIGSWTVTMTNNTYADGISDPMYLYSVASVTPIETTENEGDSQTSSSTSSETASNEITVNAVYNGLSDGHTAEMTLPDGTVNAYQFTDSNVASKLQEYNVGDAITFTYTQESKDAAMVITNVE